MRSEKLVSRDDAEEFERLLASFDMPDRIIFNVLVRYSAAEFEELEQIKPGILAQFANYCVTHRMSDEICSLYFRRVFFDLPSIEQRKAIRNGLLRSPTFNTVRWCVSFLGSLDLVKDSALQVYSIYARGLLVRAVRELRCGANTDMVNQTIWSFLNTTAWLEESDKKFWNISKTPKILKTLERLSDIYARSGL